MTMYTLKSGANEHTEDQVLQFVTDMVIRGGVHNVFLEALKVEPQGSPDMTVKIKAGRSYVKNQSGNVYPVISDAEESVVVTPNSSGNTRIDTVVLYIDFAASVDDDASEVAKMAIVEGTPAASPEAPDDATIQTSVGASSPFLRLGNVSVSSGASSITSENITDVRNEVALSSVRSDWDIPNITMPVFLSTTNGIDSLTMAEDLTALYQKNHKVKLIDDDEVEKYFEIYDITATTIELVGEVSVVGTVTSFEISSRENPIGMKNWSANFKARITLSADQAITSATTTTVELDNELWDDNNNFDNSSTYKWTCPVTGYYFIHTIVRCDAIGISRIFTGIQVDGVSERRGNDSDGPYSEDYNEILNIKRGQEINMVGFIEDSSGPNFSTGSTMAIQFLSI